MEEWKEYRLGEVCIYNTERIPLNLLNEENYISTENMLPNIGGVTISSNLPTSGNAVHFYNGDILISNIRPYFKKIWYANKEGGCSADVLCIRANKEIDKQYLYYLLSQQDFFDYVMAGAKGCKMPRGDKQHIMNWEISLPSLPTQQKIASILSSLDDKIEVNRRINEQLEELAQALFKSWFVDFEPFKDGDFVESELGMIPKGWKVCELSDILYISKDSINPSKTPDNLFHHYSIPAYDNSKREEVQEGKAIMSNKFKVTSKTTLFSKLNPRIKRVWFIDNVKENAICSTEFVPYKAKNNELTYYVNGLINSDLFYNQALSIVNGATGSHQRFHPQDTLKFNIAFNESVAKEFSTIVEPVVSKILVNQQEIRHLTALRDTLLPKLMSGEIDVNEVEL